MGWACQGAGLGCSWETGWGCLEQLMRGSQWDWRTVSGVRTKRPLALAFNATRCGYYCMDGRVPQKASEADTRHYSVLPEDTFLSRTVQPTGSPPPRKGTTEGYSKRESNQCV